MEKLIANLRDSARYLLQNGQTEQGISVQACVTLLTDEGGDDGPLPESKLYSLLMTCTQHAPARLPPGYVAFARAIEKAHGIGVEGAKNG